MSREQNVLTHKLYFFSKVHHLECITDIVIYLMPNILYGYRKNIYIELNTYVRGGICKFRMWTRTCPMARNAYLLLPAKVS